MAMLKLAPPWIRYANEMAQLFKYDKEVHVVYDNDQLILSLYVDSQRKADALAELLPETVTFGNMELHINVVPANGALSSVAGLNKAVLFANAFENNGAFAFIKTVTGIFSNNLTYVVFKNRVVQYYNDDLGDIYGQCSTLYQEIAKNIFGNQEGIYFCTDIEESVTVQDKLCNCVPTFNSKSYWP